MPPSQPSTATRIRQPSTACAPAAAPSPMPPSSRLASGPLTAIANAVRAVGGSSVRVSPPSAHKVTSRTVIPALRATSACATSCTTKLISSSRALTTPAAP